MVEQRYYGYDFGTSPRKLEPIPTRRVPQKEKTYPNKKKVQSKKNKVQKAKLSQLRKQKIKMMIYLGIFFGILFAISYRYSLINEEFNNVQKTKKNLLAIQKENEQTRIEIENNINLNNIEKIAKEKLGMQKLDQSQIVYVELDKKDYIETASKGKKDDDNIFSSFLR